MDKTVRRVTDVKAQREETYRYWRSRPISERMNAIAEIVQTVYSLKGIDLETLPRNRTLIRLDNQNWKAA